MNDNFDTFKAWEIGLESNLLMCMQCAPQCGIPKFKQQFVLCLSAYCSDCWLIAVTVSIFAHLFARCLKREYRVDLVPRSDERIMQTLFPHSTMKLEHVTRHWNRRCQRFLKPHCGNSCTWTRTNNLYSPCNDSRLNYEKKRRIRYEFRNGNYSTEV